MPFKVENDDGELSGDTNFIMVDKQSLFTCLLQTAVDEISSLKHWKKIQRARQGLSELYHQQSTRDNKISTKWTCWWD